jgi:SWI/SNF-related matrix-associated actin-dependent regulator of chromatin subfamily A member 5
MAKVLTQDSDTNPNTTASSVAGDAADGRRRRSEANNLRKTILGKKHGRLDDTKVFMIPYG